MLGVFLDVVFGALIFATGVGVGINVRNQPAIQTAIATLQKAEADAKNVLSTITAHKAS